MTTITIRVQQGQIVMPKEGNLRINPQGAVTWQCPDKDLEFRLTFHYLPFEGMPPGSGDWPFTGSPPATAPSTGWLAQDFSATASGDGVFKYDVETKDTNGNILRLDPIIIIRS
jgi:hypothetical protein